MDRFLKYKLSNGRGPDAQFSQPTTFGHGPDASGWYYGHVNHTGELPDLNAWQAVELTAEQVKAAGYGSLDPAQAKLDRLWQSATSYQSDRLDANGVAAIIGHRVQAELSGAPHTKADAIIGWWQGIWADYETRRSAILDGGELDCDFSAHGELPCRVAEALAETQPDLIINAQE